MSVATCSCCGAVFERPPGTKNKTCSQECREKRMWTKPKRPPGSTSGSMPQEFQVRDPIGYLAIATELETAMPWEREALRAKLASMREEAQ